MFSFCWFKNFLPFKARIYVFSPNVGLKKMTKSGRFFLFPDRVFLQFVAICHLKNFYTEQKRQKNTKQNVVFFMKF